MTSLFSAPLEALEPGARFTTRGRTITESDVVTFSGLTGDWHPQHADAEWARESAFGERIAHGLLVFSCAAGLIPFDPERVVALRRVRSVTFKRPVRFGSTIHVEGKIADIAPAGDDTGLVSCDLDVLDERARTVVRAQVDVIWRRGDAAAPAGEQQQDAGEVVPL
jgi:3-hydroxybutyryl-CoA dehydratase